MPDSVRFGGSTFDKRDVGCKSLAEWSQIQRTPIGAYRPIGHIGSAVYFFQPQMITQLHPDPTYHQYQWFLAKSGGCYIYYQNELGG
jgi:hypothetical protein